MSKPMYEVFYIDKFSSGEAARIALANLRTRFNLNPSTMKQMNSQKPVSIKRQVPLNVAEKYCQVIKESGGTAWVEEMQSGRARLRDRRNDKRRILMDRRDCYRGSAIMPDRRASPGRRSND